jgi:hypothetical protein
MMRGSMSRQDAWREIAEMTEIMLSHARSGEWSAVIEMESDRQLLMQKYFSIAPQLEDAEWIIDGIRTVMKIDREIMELGKNGINKLGENLAVIQRGKKAQFAYQKLA